jgi:hypothetical protein
MSKEAFDAHFSEVHHPYHHDEFGNRMENAKYVAPENANAGAHGAGLPFAEHRAGPYSEQGHSTGVAATEKRIPVPNSFNAPADSGVGLQGYQSGRTGGDQNYQDNTGRGQDPLQARRDPNAELSRAGQTNEGRVVSDRSADSVGDNPNASPKAGGPKPFGE